TPVAALALTAGVPAADAAVVAPASQTRAPAVPCAALTGLVLPDLPGSDTATLSSNQVPGSGDQAAIESPDTSDPPRRQPGNIGTGLRQPDTWNGSYRAEGGGL